MFQPVFSVFLFIYCTLNCHNHSANTKPRNMLMFLLFVKRIFLYVEWGIHIKGDGGSWWGRACDVSRSLCCFIFCWQ